ncbi:MAG: hypothetical protein HY271_09390 [Deltaproteobacteria bacterium]|nr:hypothetical protein [Deltaproteobacteria bacterium]
MRKIDTIVFPLFAVLLLTSAAPARAETKCEMTFHLEGWSAFYKTAKGGGRITCNNGQAASIVIRTKGGGVTFGVSKIVGGIGHFSPVANIGEVFGDYANAEAHAGAGESSDAQVVTKGTVSLALSGKGRGVNLGFAFGKFTIARAAVRRHAAPSRPRLEEAPLDDRAPARRSAESPPSGAAY